LLPNGLHPNLRKADLISRRKRISIQERVAKRIPIPRSEVWPIPSDAEFGEKGIRYVVLVATELERPPKVPDCTISVDSIEYDQSGKFVGSHTGMILGLDTLQPEWRHLYQTMTIGELRRVWSPDAKNPGRLKISDLYYYDVLWPSSGAEDREWFKRVE